MTRPFVLPTAFVLIFALVPAALAQKFRSDDPLPADNDKAVDVTSITKHKLNDQYDFVQHSFGKPGDRSKGQAANANTIGEVPDSSWFQNRHGMVPMSLSELTRGPDTGEGPSTEQPWLIIQAKTEGVTPGFRIRDARGDVYFIKFDPLENPEMSTAAEVISTKFFYAIGYNVPENYIAFFRRDDLRIDEKAKLTEADLDQLLKRVPRRRDGTYRALASKLLPGSPIGPFQYFGTRPDDPNDIFPHENRRELRGLRVFAAWLNHDDSRAINTLDMLAKEDGRHYVKHYLIDFGSTLGSGSTNAQKPRAGSEYLWEPKPMLARIATLGLWDRKWIHTKYPQYPSIGNFEATDFEPENWKPEYPNPAFLNMNDQDAYWAAKIVMAFTEEDIRAIVRTGQLSDPEAEDYLAETLIARQRKVGRTWLTRVSSFDEFGWTASGELRFGHLGSFYDFVRKPEFRVSWFTFDNMTGERKSIDQFQPRHDGYYVASLSSVEGAVDVYVRTVGGADEPEIVGIERR
jgi:hypothetical protein